MRTLKRRLAGLPLRSLAFQGAIILACLLLFPLVSISLAFTLTASIALILMVVFLVRVEARRQFYLGTGRNGDSQRALNFLVRLVSVRTLNALMLFLAGIGIFTGARWLAYGIALIPITFIVATIQDLRDL
jgi:L-asparagine transporter-like permease